MKKQCLLYSATFSQNYQHAKYSLLQCSQQTRTDGKTGKKGRQISCVLCMCVCVTELIANIHTACINYRQTTVFSWLFIHSASNHNVCDKVLHISCFILEHKIGSLSSVNKLVKLNCGKMCMLIFVLYIKLKIIKIK